MSSLDMPLAWNWRTATSKLTHSVGAEGGVDGVSADDHAVFGVAVVFHGKGRRELRLAVEVECAAVCAADRFGEFLDGETVLGIAGFQSVQGPGRDP